MNTRPLIVLTSLFLAFACCEKKDNPKPTSHTITLQPGSASETGNSGKDTYVVNFSPDVNYNADNKIYTSAWTYSGNDVNIYTLIQFDYSKIPANAEITSAYLNLYANSTTNFPGSPNPMSGHYGGNDNTYLKRITSSWNDKTVTWNSKPTQTNDNMVYLNATTSNAQDFLNIDVTKIVKDQIKFGNYGFEFGLQNYTPYKRVVFNSSEAANSSVRPKLVINYK